MKRLALIAILALAGCEPQTPSYRQGMDPMFVRMVAPSTVAGSWHQIAVFPNPVEAGCRKTTVAFSPRPDGSYGVIQRCQRGNAWTQIVGTATVTSKGQFRLAMEGARAQDIRILGTGKDGRTLLLGTRDRMTGWLLHRDAQMTETQRREARDIFGKNGYDRAAMQLIAQR